MAKKEYNKTRTTGRRTVTKTRSADGSKSRTVTRAKKDGTTKVKSKTKSGNTVTRRKVTVGPKKTTRKDAFFEIGERRSGAKSIHGEVKTTTQSVKGKETVKNRKAKKGEVKKTKSKIDGTQSTTTRRAKIMGTRYPGGGSVYAPKAVMVDGKREKRGFHSSKNGQSQTTTTTTPAKRTTVKTKIKKRGRR